MSLHIAQNKCSKAGVVDHLGLRKNTKHYGDAKILFITEGGRNSLSHMLVLVKVAFVSVSYDFLESAPLPRDRGHVCVRREHVFELCTGCPRPLSCSQHVSSNGCVYNSALPSLCFLTFSGFPFRRPRLKTEGSAVVSRHLRSEPGAVLQCKPHACTSHVPHPLTQSSCQNNHNVKQVPNDVDCGVAQLLMWSVWKYGDYS